jgi:hypothetical protein
VGGPFMVSPVKLCLAVPLIFHSNCMLLAGDELVNRHVETPSLPSAPQRKALKSEPLRKPCRGRAQFEVSD